MRRPSQWKIRKPKIIIQFHFNVLLLLYLIPVYFPSLWTTCDVLQSSTVNLACPAPQSLIFAAEIADSAVYLHDEFPSFYVVHVIVKEQFVGNLPGQTLTVLLASGQHPLKGEKWLVFTGLHNGHYFAGGLCNETTRLDNSEFTNAMVNRLRLFRDARQAPGYNPITARHFLSGKVAARGAFLSGKPFGEWTHYYPDGAIRASYHFDSTGLEHGYNHDYARIIPKLSRQHYDHGFKDTVWTFRDTTARLPESMTTFRNTAAGQLEIYRMEYDSLARITYAEYSLLSAPSEGTTRSDRSVLVSDSKKFDPPPGAGSKLLYDSRSRIWQISGRK